MAAGGGERRAANASRTLARGCALLPAALRCTHHAARRHHALPLLRIVLSRACARRTRHAAHLCAIGLPRAGLMTIIESKRASGDNQQRKAAAWQQAMTKSQ